MLRDELAAGFAGRDAGFAGRDAGFAGRDAGFSEQVISPPPVADETCRCDRSHANTCATTMTRSTNTMRINTPRGLNMSAIHYQELLCG